MRIGEEKNPTSPEDLPYHVFIEQLQRIADQLSMAIEGLIAAAAVMARIHLYVTRHTGVIHGDQYEILDQFSKVSFFRASPCFWRHSDAGMGSLLVCLQGPHRLYENKPCPRAASGTSHYGERSEVCVLILQYMLSDFPFCRYSNPETDFRVLGIKVFTDTIGAKYQAAM
jgi:hypothetical protein